MPKMEPAWDPNSRIGKTMLKQYQQLILYGVQHGVPKPKNVSKLYEVRQKPEENPSAFYERLCKDAHRWTDSDPENEANTKMFNTLFIGQSASDIRRRLQRVGGAGGVLVAQQKGW